MPPTLAFLQQHFDQVPRSSRGRVMVRCNLPGHPDHTPSMSWNLGTGKWKCFGCGRRGDQIDYLMFRDGLNFKSAARALGVWRDDITPAERVKFEREQQERKRRREQDSERTEQARRDRIDACGELHNLERSYDAAGKRLGELLGGLPERYCGEEALAWWFLSDTLPRIRAAESRYFILAGLEDHHV
jgi:hypothetical protein